MLSLSIGGQLVELPQDFSLTMNLKSPIFSEVGSYSYPFKIPNSPRNSIRMGFRHRVASTGDPYRTDQGVFRWRGLNLFSGLVRMKVLNSSSFEGNLIEGAGDFNFSRKNETLQNADYGELIFSSEQLRLNYINSCANKVYPQSNIVFPQILNKTYFEELPINTGLHYFNIYINSLIKSEFTGGLTERTIIVPMLYVRYVLNKIFEHLGYAFDDTFFSSDADYNSLALFNLVDCNSHPNGFFLYDFEKLYLNYHVPRMSMNDFFAGLESFFNVRFFVNNLLKTIKLISVDKIVKQTQYVEFSNQIISISTEPSDQITGYHLSMTMDTDDELYESRKALDEVRLTSLKESVQSVSDLLPWPCDDILDLRYVIDQNTYYIMWSNKQWIPWDDTVDLYLQYRYRTDNLSIETKFSTLLNDNIGDDAIVGNARENWKKVTGKLFFTRYVVGGVIGNKVVATPVTENNSLYFGGENGLFNKHYKAYFDFRITSKLVKIVKQMEFTDLKDFDFSKKYMINGIKYLVASIQVNIKKDRIMPATLECYPCP